MKRTIATATTATLTTLLGSSCVTSPSSTVVPEVANAVSPAAGVVAAGRLTLEDIARLQRAGIRHVIDLTAEAETPEFDEESAVRSVGIGYSNLPLTGAEDLTQVNVAAFDRLLHEAQRPLLVHCASGNRVGAIAALRAAWIDGKSVEEAVAIGKAWGLKGLEPQVRERIEARR
jgi:uncharacterized protein (TIGR01244 family)